MKYPVLLLNTTIATVYPGAYRLTGAISPEAARAYLGKEEILSAIGHESTAQAMSTILSRAVPVNRVPAAQQIGQKAIVLKVKGRLPEGKILSLAELTELGFDLLLMERID